MSYPSKCVAIQCVSSTCYTTSYRDTVLFIQAGKKPSTIHFISFFCQVSRFRRHTLALWKFRPRQLILSRFFPPSRNRFFFRYSPRRKKNSAKVDQVSDGQTHMGIAIRVHGGQRQGDVHECMTLRSKNKCIYLVKNGDQAVYVF